MKYDVDWVPSAQDKLADLWTQAADRQAITDAANEADRLLAHDPESKGEDFYGDRLLVVPPLHIVFTADRSKQHVLILDVWLV
jgi:hypothetical protein